MLRISGGTLRGRVLQVSPDGWIRPTMGRVREAMFSMLAQQIPGATVLDLFAGCGLLGLEALSRGAHSVFFVDLEPKAVQLIKKNCTMCGMGERGVAQPGDALLQKTLNRVKYVADQHHGNCRAFDLVFIDPPYRRGLVTSSLQVLAQMPQTGATQAGETQTATQFLAANVLIVTEQEADAKIEALATWHMLQNRRYGDTRIIFWQRLPTQETTP